MKRSNTQTIISALRILARDIQSEDGVANACILEAAHRMEELDGQVKMACEELVETHMHAERVALSVGLSQEQIDGDSYYVPTTEHLIDMIVDRLNQPISQ